MYTDTGPGGGDCYYWSDVPGGIDAWDPANDPIVIGITTTLPECPVIVVDVVTRAWEVFRQWDLEPPSPVATPSIGITGVPTHVTSPVEPNVTHSEVLPDGRTLDVRARAALLTLDWGDGTVTEHDPAAATPHPNGAVSHAYGLKTCTAAYRDTHPSGDLCHPTLDEYTITASFVWVGEYSLGSGWNPLGTLTVSVESAYDVDEALGLPGP